MARIRSIHPDACESHTLAAVDGDTERTFWRLLTHCDDHGRMRADPQLVASRCYAVMRHVDADTVAGHLRRLAEIGLIGLYHDGHRAYLHVVSWGEFQHPKNPGLAQHPDPETCEALDPDSLTAYPDIPHSYPTSTPGLPQAEGSPNPGLTPGDRRGSKEVGEGEGGGEGEGEEHDDDADASPSTDPDPVAEQFDDFWRHYPRHSRNGKPGGGGSRAKALQRWRSMTAQQRDQAMAAVDNYRAWCERDDGELAAHATTWLNEQRWEQWQEPAPPPSQTRNGGGREPPGSKGGQYAAMYRQAADEARRQGR